MRKLIFSKDGKDILHGINLKCTKAIWECYDVFHDGLKMCEIMFGEPKEILDGYSWHIEEATPADIEKAEKDRNGVNTDIEGDK